MMDSTSDSPVVTKQYSSPMWPWSVRFSLWITSQDSFFPMILFLSYTCCLLLHVGPESYVWESVCCISPWAYDAAVVQTSPAWWCRCMYAHVCSWWPMRTQASETLQSLPHHQRCFPFYLTKIPFFVIWVFLEGGVIPRKLNNIFCLGINRMEFPLNFNLFRKAT